MADFDACPLLITETASVWDVTCPGCYKHRSDEECVAATHLVFPYRGVYVHHVGRAETVAEANQLIILNEDDELVGFGDGLRSTHVVHVDPAVREHEMRCSNAFLVAPVLVAAWACDVPD